MKYELKEISELAATLNSRGRTHGDFIENSVISQEFKEVIRECVNYDIMNCPMKEALDMICHKIGRICAGDPFVADHWHDIAGYATLVEKQLMK